MTREGERTEEEEEQKEAMMDQSHVTRRSHKEQGVS